MKNSTRPPDRRRPGRLVLLLAGALASLPAAAESLAQIFERAWQLAPAGRTVEARGDEAAASRTAAEAWFPSAPSVGYGQRNDRLNDGRGKLEHEVELAVPLWLPGQKTARQALAMADGEENRAATLATRLAVAGELRAALWALQLARAESAIATERRELAERLEADVERRVKAGNLARTDHLLARQETMAARSAALAAQTRALQAGQRYRVLTGVDFLPDDPEEKLGQPASEHPRLTAAQALVERARAGLGLARASGRDAPTASLQFRRDRDESGLPARDSVRFAVSIPLSTEARNQPLLAAANTALVRTEAEHRRLLAEVEADERGAAAELEAAGGAADFARGQAEAADERLALLRRSFELGETALPEFLRAQALAVEARIEAARARTRLSAARANLNQARGLLP